MNDIADFDRHVVEERNEGIRREVRTLLLESQLRDNGGPRSNARPTALFPNRFRRR